MRKRGEKIYIWGKKAKRLQVNMLRKKIEDAKNDKSSSAQVVKQITYKKAFK